MDICIRPISINIDINLSVFKYWRNEIPCDDSRNIVIYNKNKQKKIPEHLHSWSHHAKN